MKKAISIDLNSVPGFGKLLKSHLSTNSGFESKTIEKQLNFRSEFKHREILNSRLIEQNKTIDLSSETQKNIALIKEKNTVCITTGHQLALIGGPLFVAYKILTTVKLAKQYKQKYPTHNFVPVFWLASEDHDKAEIDHFTVHGKDFHWETTQTGAVGKFNTDGIISLLENIEKEINGLDSNLIDLFKKAYLQKNISEATRYFVNELFGEYGVIIIDGDDKELKKLFLPTIKQEVTNKLAFTNVNITNEKLKAKGFEPAINPRELNLFLLTENDRKRIEFNEKRLRTTDESFNWSIDEFISFSYEHPEQISPNVLLRPIYQETILPNIAYVGGPAETEYWLQLDDLFLACGIETPQRVLRICNTLINEKNLSKLNELGLKTEDLFENETDLIKKVTTLLGGENLNFENEKNELAKLYDKLAIKAKHIDPTLEGSVKAEHARQEKALDGLFSKLVKAEKTKQEIHINRVVKSRNSVLPNGKPQERTNTLFETGNENHIALFNYILESAELNTMNIALI
jgi:bacillithiol biosynthesis cysteine-adding enzyme BshC